ncbi:MAG: YbaB/EbfC family nucleoid-associated protein [Proteobacteria bacterium]|nr:YbaB/EbfC family nucleoid-associated protein [Pseudomonadota bacterium]
MSDDKSGGPPGFDMNALLGQVMEQAKTVQDRVSQTTEKVKTMTAEGSAGGGLVKVTATGDGKIKTIRIDKVCLTDNDTEMLEDLLVAGCNDALRRAGELVGKEMSSVTGGMNLGDLLGSFGK